MSETAEQKEWRISSDADTIKEFGKIVADSKRYAAAKKFIADEMEKAKKVMDGSFWDKMRGVKKKEA